MTQALHNDSHGAICTRHAGETVYPDLRLRRGFPSHSRNKLGIISPKTASFHILLNRDLIPRYITNANERISKTNPERAFKTDQLAEATKATVFSYNFMLFEAVNTQQNQR